MAAFDRIGAFTTVTATELTGSNRSVSVQLSGLQDEQGEEGTTEPLFGTIGLVVRPKPPSDGVSAEVVALKLGDGLIPVAARDVRINKVVNPKDGEVLLVGYGGGFISLKDNDDGDGTSIVIYAPGGNGARASAISIDTTAGNDHVAVMHSSGVSITLTEEGKAIIASPNGENYIEVGNSGIVINGNVQITGSVVVGNPASALPVALGPAPGTTSTILKASIA